MYVGRDERDIVSQGTIHLNVHTRIHLPENIYI